MSLSKAYNNCLKYNIIRVRTNRDSLIFNKSYHLFISDKSQLILAIFKLLDGTYLHLVDLGEDKINKLYLLKEDNPGYFEFLYWDDNYFELGKVLYEKFS